jgi:hypothetical protein
MHVTWLGGVALRPSEFVQSSPITRLRLSLFQGPVFFLLSQLNITVEALYLRTFARSD